MLGSTGNYAYLTRDERGRVARLSVEAAGGTPGMVGIGATHTSQVLAHAEDAQSAGAAAPLLAPGPRPLRPLDPAARRRLAEILGLEP